jgi:two-component system response regulator DegU
LKLIARQKSTIQIADMLFISPKTVANHRSNIGKKLKLSGKQNGLLEWAMKQEDQL